MKTVLFSKLSSTARTYIDMLGLSNDLLINVV